MQQQATQASAQLPMSTQAQTLQTTACLAQSVEPCAAGQLHAHRFN